jgi:hypothetical protein
MEINKLKLNLIDELSDLEIKLLKEEINALPDMEEGKIDFYTMYVCELNEFLESKLLIRSTADKEVFFEKLVFLLADENGNILGNQEIDLGFLGQLPKCSVTPATILFDRSKFKIEGVDLNKCKILVTDNSVQTPSEKLVLNYMDESIDEINKRIFERTIEDYPPVIKNNIEIITPKLVVTEENASVPIIIFNGYDKNVNLNNLTIELKNTLNIIKASKVVPELPVELSPYTANVYNFIFEEKDLFGTLDELRSCTISIRN